MIENIFNISISLSIIPTIELNNLRENNDLMKKKITELIQEKEILEKEKEILQKIILSKHT